MQVFGCNNTLFIIDQLKRKPTSMHIIKLLEVVQVTVPQLVLVHHLHHLQDLQVMKE